METTATIAESPEQAHDALLVDVRRLQQMVRPDAEVSLAELQKRLSATYTNVCAHFRREEQDGFLDEMEANEPRLQRLVQQMMDEHRDLRQRLDSLHGDAIMATRVDEALREKVRRWTDALLRHEVRENDLVQDEFDSDCAAQD